MLGIIKAVTGGLTGVGNTYRQIRESKHGNTENQLQRDAASFVSARGFKPDGWLGRQIRPILTLVICGPLLVIALAMTILVAVALYPVVIGAVSVAEGVTIIKPIFGLFDALSENYFNVAMIVIVFWFGGRMQKYIQNHIEAKHEIKNPKPRKEQKSVDKDSKEEYVDLTNPTNVDRLAGIHKKMDEEQKRNK